MELTADTLGLALPIFTGFHFEAEDMSKLRMRIELFDDMIAGIRFQDGRPREVYALDPDDVGGALGNVTLGSGLLPRNCLFWQKVGGQERLAIFVEPKVWAVSVEREKKTWHVPMPGLVLVGQAQKYQMYATKEQQWPVGDTPLYHAPCPNVWGDRGVCTGNAPFPVAGVGTIWQALEVFFSSGFNTHLAGGKSKRFRDDILGQWRALDEANAGEYPEDDLVAANVTLKQIEKDGAE